MNAMKDIHRSILHTLSYFQFFKYAPTESEAHRYLQSKITASGLKKELKILIKNKKIKSIKLEGEKSPRYTLGEYIIRAKYLQIKAANSIKKKKKAKLYLHILSWFSQIKMIGLSGSVAMLNAEADDDIDLFIITKKGRMWTARMIGLILAQILGLRRKRGENKAENKVCLNLFFDETDLQLPKHKKTEYGAHEVLQMKPVIDKNHTYDAFIKANSWVFQWFPNADKRYTIPTQVKSAVYRTLSFIRVITDFIEELMKKFQLARIRKHQTTEIITDTQLWFFPRDFEKKMNS